MCKTKGDFEAFVSHEHSTTQYKRVKGVYCKNYFGNLFMTECEWGKEIKKLRGKNNGKKMKKFFFWLIMSV